MKKNNLINKLGFILMMCSYIAFGQTLPNFKINSKDSIFKSTVGGDIKIELSLNASDASLITLRCALNPYISKLNDSVYLVRFPTHADEAKIKLYYKNLPIQIKTYKIEELPLPNLLVNGSSSEIKKKVAGDKRMHTLEWSEGIDFEKNNFRIYNAKVVLTEEGKPPMTFQMRQSELPQTLYNVLPSLKNHTTITVSEINFANNYGNVFLMKGLWTFKVVE